MRDPDVHDRYNEFVTQTTATEPPTELAELAESIAADHGPAETAQQISTAVHDAVTYVVGATEVHTVAAEAWQARQGVCQDYAHLVVGALRHVGIPARYVSGYLHPSSAPVDRREGAGREPRLGRVVAGGVGAPTTRRTSPPSRSGTS